MNADAGGGRRADHRACRLGKIKLSGVRRLFRLYWFPAVMRLKHQRRALVALHLLLTELHG